MLMEAAEAAVEAPAVVAVEALAVVVEVTAVPGLVGPPSEELVRKPGPERELATAVAPAAKAVMVSEILTLVHMDRLTRTGRA